MGTGVEAVVIGEVIAAEAFAGAVIAGGLEFSAGAFLASALPSVALNFASSMVMSAFKDTPSSSGAAVQNKMIGQQQMIRSTVAERRVVYGQARVSGPIIHGTTSGNAAPDDNAFLWLVIPLADHEVEAIDDIYFNDEPIPNSYLDGSGNVIAGRFSGHAGIRKHLGAAGQTVDTSLASIDPTWDANRIGNGVAYIVVWMLWNREVYTSGIPNISALVRGKKLYDPRDAGTRYSANWALVVRDFLTDTQYGMGCLSTEINDAAFIAAANICDERVLLPTASPQSDALYSEFTASSDDTITTNLNELLQTGDGVRVEATTIGSPLLALPPPLAAATTYYWIRQAAGVGKLATSFANAFAGTAINLTDDGAGRITYYDQARYEAQGTVNTGEPPMSVLKGMLPAAAGTLVYQQGEWMIYAGAYRSTVGTLVVSDLRDDFEVQAQPSRRSLYNMVRGVFSDPNSGYQPIDFPPMMNATYATQDGEQIPHDISLAFTVNYYRAQRIAKIFLEKSRQAITGVFPCKPTVFKYTVWDNVAITIAALGWTAKEFTVTEWKLNPDGSVDLMVQEESASSYTWSASDAVVADQAPDTELANPNIPGVVTGLTLASGTDVLLLAGDGTVHSRIRVRWNAFTNVFVTSGGAVEIEYALAAGSPQDWKRIADAPGSASEAFITPVEDGAAYYVRVRGRTSTGGVGSAWTIASHTVVGKSAAPSNVTGFAAVQTGAVVLFACETVTDADLDSIEIRYGESATWADATPIANILRGQTATTAALPPGTWVILAKAKDTSGNYSANAVSTTLIITSTGFTSIAAQGDSPDWFGTKTNMVEHWTGVLTPDSQSLASALDWEVFDQFVPNAYADCYYTASVIDKGIDGYARVYADIVSVLGPGETTGTASPAFEIDYRLAAGSFDGFEDWAIGNATFRYLQPRIHVDTSLGKVVISAFDVTIDAATRSETGTLTVGGGGSGTVTFTNQFHSTPAIQVSPSGSGDVSASYGSASSTGFTGYFKSGGAAAAGDISWRADGI